MDNHKLNYKHLLATRDKLAVAAYTRNETTKQKELAKVLEQLIVLYLRNGLQILFKLFNPMEIETTMCKDKNYRITKCVTLQDWNNNFQIRLLPEGSLKAKFVATFNMCGLTYDLEYKITSKDCHDFYVTKKQDMLYHEKGHRIKFGPPSNGDILQIKVEFKKEISEDCHYLQVQIRDHHRRSIACINMKFKGMIFKNHSLYLYFERQSDDWLGYRNGILLIETYPKVYKDKLQSFFLPTDHSLFKHDYIFTAH